jgi:dTDP-4-amino-4,6-dideoxygalactose transaminase
MVLNNDDFIVEFEQRLASYTGAPYVVAVDRCTNAILLAVVSTLPAPATVTLPRHTYLSVPMTLILHGYTVQFVDNDWVGSYNIGNTSVYDCAVGFDEGMYKPGQIQCLSFQQKKRLPIGKGGAILLDDVNLYHKLQRLRHDGRNSRISVQEEMGVDPDSITIGYHVNMSPDEAARGILLLNQLQPSHTTGGYANYPDISTLRCFKGYTI